MSKEDQLQGYGLDMAYLSDLGESTIYNFVSGRRNGGLHKETIKKLQKFIEEEENNEK